MATIIVESPNIASKVIGNLMACKIHAQVLSTYGHLYDYDLDTNRNVSMLKKRPDVIATLHELNRQRADIIIATDPDDQGELIGLHIQSLTPNCRHRRLIINDMSIQGFIQSIQRFNDGDYSFDPHSAKKAFLLKMLNLTLQSQKTIRGNSALYLTTPSLSILNALKSTAEPIVENKFQLNIDNTLLNCRDIATSTKINPDNQYQISRDACTSNDIYQSNIQNDIVDELQQSFESGSISYPRTNVNVLPIHAISTIKEWTALNDFVHDITPFSNSAELSHYALHNTASPETQIERQIQSLNRIAIGNDLGGRALIKIDSDSGKIFGSSINQRQRENSSRLLAPSERIKSILISQEASASTLQVNSNKYAKLFYRADNRLCRSTVSNLESIASQQCSKLLDMSVDHFLEQLISRQGESIRSDDIKQEVTIINKKAVHQIEDTLSGHHF